MLSGYSAADRTDDSNSVTTFRDMSCTRHSDRALHLRLGNSQRGFGGFHVLLGRDTQVV
jgi:hypothetical protein